MLKQALNNFFVYCPTYKFMAGDGRVQHVKVFLVIYSFIYCVMLLAVEAAIAKIFLNNTTTKYTNGITQYVTNS